MASDDTWSFEGWIDWVFDRPEHDPDWDFGTEPPPTVAIDFLTSLFDAPEQLIARFSDAQIDRGLTCIMNPAWSDHAFAFLTEEVPLAKRIAGVGSFTTLFRALYAKRCTNTLGHLDEPGANPLNKSCYMWWDLSPFYGGRDGDEHRTIDNACLDVMEAVLTIENVACRESALHGLGHYAIYDRYRDRCQ